MVQIALRCSSMILTLEVCNPIRLWPQSAWLGQRLPYQINFGELYEQNDTTSYVILYIYRNEVKYNGSHTIRSELTYPPGLGELIWIGTVSNYP